MNKAKAEELIKSVLDGIFPPTAKTYGDLYGPGGCLDSIGLLTLVVQLEEQVEKASSVEIRLVSERAFAANGPFSTVDTLAAYVSDLVNVEANRILLK